MPSTGSTTRLGTRTTQNHNPQDLLPDVDEMLRRVDPTLLQFTTLLDKMPKGKKPRTNRIDCREYRPFDYLDQITGMTVGISGNNETRFANITVAQRSLIATTPTDMIYQPGDRLVIVETGQVVEVMATPTENLSGLPSFSATLVGNGTQLPNPGHIIVRNIQPVAIIDLSSALPCFLKFMGHGFHEGQPMESKSWMRDPVYNYNWLGNTEKVIEYTEEETDLIMTRGSIRDIDFQKEESYQEIKTDVELMHMDGKGAFDAVVRNKPKLHMRGLLDFVNTNQMVYNPLAANLNFEQLIRTWMTNQLFRYCPDGMRKLVLVGERLSDAFMQVFDVYRRKDISGGQQANLAGVSFTSYEFNGRVIDLLTYRHFRIETPQAWWALGVNLPQIEARPHTEYRFRDATLADQRIIKHVIEWKGSMAVHLEETHALLRTA